MDLNSMLNDGDAPPGNVSQSSSPTAQRNPQPPAFGAPPGANGHSPFPSHPSQQSTPQYAPPPQDHRSPSGSMGYQGKGLTPLQTTTQSQVGQYTYSQHPSQSPVAIAGQYQSFPGQTVTTPGARPMSHGFQQPPTPSQYAQPGMPSAMYQQPNSMAYNQNSMSSTPPSRHSQTPHSVRQSPHGYPQAPQTQYNQQLQHGMSQPSTPLAPPSLQYQRSTMGSHPDVHSPYHQRQYSGASNGIVGGSPAHQQPGVGGYVDSPSAYSRQSPHLRRTSDYLNQMDRERSVSVSPKTRVPPRIPSLGSRNSSLQESYSTSGSFHQPMAPSHESQSHVQPSYPGQQPAVAQPSFAQQTNDVAQAPLLTTPLSQSGAAATPVQPNPLSLSAQSSQQQHQTQKMGMNHLLAPSDSHSMSHSTHDSAVRRQSIDMLIQPNAASNMGAPPPQPPPIKSEPSVTSMHDASADTLLQQPMSSEPVDNNASQTSIGSLKRAADGELAAEPPVKRERRRKYTQRPIWAQLQRVNPRFVAAENPASKQQNGMAPQRTQPSTTRQAPRPSPQPARGPSQQPNGRPPVNGKMKSEDGQQDQPLDNDLIHARQILGPWEKSFKWQTPAPDMLKVVQDWIWKIFAANADIGNDPRYGAFEIEAKIGTICDSGHDRIQLPVSSMCVLSPSANGRYRFESQMQEPEHAAMNAYLNETLQETHANPQRIPMKYEHLYQLDSFSPLSPAGFAALPPSARRLQPAGHDTRLRTTRDVKKSEGSPPVIARIVKLNLGNLHLYNPNALYDCRISINLEVNLFDRPDLKNPDSLILPDPDGVPIPERRKDRLSYKHCAYSIDLTKVESSTAAPKYELELEVDAALVREQMRKAGAGEDNAYGDVVSGFLDNAIYLMRQRPGPV